MDHLKLKLTVAYDGTHYKGWQLQKNGITVQQRIEEALRRLFPPAAGARLSRGGGTHKTRSYRAAGAPTWGRLGSPLSVLLARAPTVFVTPALVRYVRGDRIFGVSR